MKLEKENSFIRSIVVCLLMGTTLILCTESLLCQDLKSLKFNDCKNYEDTCLYIGQMFIKDLYDYSGHLSLQVW
jgi:hypothetical protein